MAQREGRATGRDAAPEVPRLPCLPLVGNKVTRPGRPVERFVQVLPVVRAVGGRCPNSIAWRARLVHDADGLESHAEAHQDHAGEDHQEPDELEDDDELDAGRLGFELGVAVPSALTGAAFILRSAPLITILPQRKVAIAATSATSHVMP